MLRPTRPPGLTDRPDQSAANDQNPRRLRSQREEHVGVSRGVQNAHDGPGLSGGPGRREPGAEEPGPDATLAGCNDSDAPGQREGADGSRNAHEGRMVDDRGRLVAAIHTQDARHEEAADRPDDKKGAQDEDHLRMAAARIGCA